MAKKPTAIPILPIATAIAKALARSGASKTVAKSGVGKFLSKPRFFVPKTTPKVTGKPGGAKVYPKVKGRPGGGKGGLVPAVRKLDTIEQTVRKTHNLSGNVRVMPTKAQQAATNKRLDLGGKPGGVKKTPTEVARTKAGEQRARDRSRWPETVVAKNKRPADLKTLVKEKKLKSDVEKILLRQKRERYGPR